MRQCWEQFCRSIAKGYRGFESAPLRHTVCTVHLQSGDSGKSARDAALLRSMRRTGESYLGSDSLNPTGVFSTRRKYGSLQGWSGFRSSILTGIALNEGYPQAIKTTNESARIKY